MDLRNFVQARLEEENSRLKNGHIQFEMPKTAGEIIDFYRAYDGLKRQMRPLSAQQVEEYLQKGYAFVGAYYDKQLAGIVASKQFPENYPYFHPPKSEPDGNIYTLVGIYVKKGLEGMGIASKLSNIITQGTERFGQQTGNAVGMAYEVSYDNYGSLKIMSGQGNYVGFYSDTSGEEGLSILLYRPFTHDAVNVQNRHSIPITQDEETSKTNLFNALETLASNPEIGGYQTYSEMVGSEDNIVTTHILNNVPNTLPQAPFSLQ